MSDALAVLDTIDAALLPAALVRLAARMQATVATSGADELLTPDEVARLLRISKKAVYNRAAELGASRVGRRLRFSRRAVVRYVERRRGR